MKSNIHTDNNMQEIRWETHNNKKILVADLAGLNVIKPDQWNIFENLIDEMKKELLSYSGDLRILYYVPDAIANRKVMGKLKEITKILKDNDRNAKRAIVGLKGIQEVLLNSANIILSIGIKPFKAKNDALVYLSSD